MSHIETYQVFPTIPEPLAFLETLSRNLWWTWNKDAKELFRRIDPPAWYASGRNPILFLANIPQNRLGELSADDGYLAHLERVAALFHQRVTAPRENGELPFSGRDVIAYFSMEFGIHESIPLFAGGLGVLAGDHLKAASNMALPLVAVGLLYRQGYFRQYLDHNGWQQEEYPETKLHYLPIERARDSSGNELRITVAGPHGNIKADVWEMRIGRIALYLLDTDFHENPPRIREITSRLSSRTPRKVHE